jgi:hypothetical protein
LRENDPCHYAYQGGGWGGNPGGGSGGSGDDSADKNGFSGGLVVPMVGQGCTGASGLRVTHMHLARGYDSGSGDSEVFMNATVWVNGNSLATAQTNGSSYKTSNYFDLGNTGLNYTLKVGKQLGKVPQSNISSTTLTNTILTPASNGILPNTGDDWVIIENGFCTGLSAYDRIYLSFYERDAGLFGNQFAAFPTSAIPYDQYQPLSMRFFTDVWVEAELNPTSFTNNVVFVVGEVATPHVYTTSATQPTNPNLTWFRIERF